MQGFTHPTTKFVDYFNWLLFIASWVFFKTPVYAAVLNDTGIKTCSDVDSNGLPCPVTGFPGQDAQYGTNSFNFTKLDANGNALPVTASTHSCVKDNVTGLVWEVKTDDGGLRDKDNTYTFNQALLFDANVHGAGDICGFTDWRVPNPQELASIIDYSVGYPTIDTNYFPNSISNRFWTALSEPYYVSNEWNVIYTSNEWWVVNFYNGWIDNDSPSNDYAVRLVRGNWWLPSYVNNNNGTITDQSTGLMWASNNSATNLTWQQALQAADSSTLAGYNDWRLPNVKELQSLVNYKAFNPVIDSSYFPYTGNNYWTASPAYNSSNTWRIDFCNGYSYDDNRTNAYFVRLVRNALVLPTAPAVSTDAPSVISVTPIAVSATLKGTVHPKGAITTVSFDFGLTATYGTSIVATPNSIAATAGATAVAANKTGLTCGTTYHYRVKAVNSKGTTLGADKAFTTAACPVDFVITNAVLTPISPVANGNFSAAVTVKNQGTSAGDGGQLRLWVNQPTVQVCAATGGDKNIAVGAIAAGASKVLNLTGINAGIGGIKTFRALVDATCVKVETNETNNQFTKTYRVTGKPDFVVTSMTVTPATPAANGNFALAVIVKNQGTAAGDGGFLDVWNNLATVPACGAEGTAWADVGVVAAGATKTLTLSLPAGVAGAKTARAFVDSWCETTEVSETNNQLTKAYIVQ